MISDINGSLILLTAIQQLEAGVWNIQKKQILGENCCHVGLRHLHVFPDKMFPLDYKWLAMWPEFKGRILQSELRCSQSTTMPEWTPCIHPY